MESRVGLKATRLQNSSPGSFFLGMRYGSPPNRYRVVLFLSILAYHGSMKKILILSGNRLAPAQTGGQVRSVSIARALARMGHEVQIFSIAGRKEDYRAAHLLRAETKHVEIEQRLSEDTHLGMILGLVQAIVRRLKFPRVWQYWFLRRGVIPRRLAAALDSADIVMSDLPYCPPVPGAWRSKPWFLISHNLEHKLLEQGGIRERQFAAWMRAVESAAPQTYTDIFACAEEDQTFFRAHDTSNKLAVPMIRCGVDPANYTAADDVRPRTRRELGLVDEDWVFLFSGSGFAPNVEAFGEIKEFCRREAAFLLQNRVHILVAGSVSSSSYREGSLIVTGRVPDVLPYFAAADAGLNMVTRGSGSNVKLFEYLAAKLPIISTPFGVRGTELNAAQDYLPCTRENLRDVIAMVTVQSRRYWREHAEAVWARHRSSCDIYALVGGAVGKLPVFQTESTAILPA
jgi:glycosyltransferase involved in cell wall biosynthesis